MRILPLLLSLVPSTFALECYDGYRLLATGSMGTSTTQCTGWKDQCYTMSASAAFVVDAVKGGCSTWRCMLASDRCIRTTFQGIPVSLCCCSTDRCNGVNGGGSITGGGSSGGNSGGGGWGSGGGSGGGGTSGGWASDRAGSQGGSSGGWGSGGSSGGGGASGGWASDGGAGNTGGSSGGGWASDTPQNLRRQQIEEAFRSDVDSGAPRNRGKRLALPEE